MSVLRSFFASESGDADTARMASAGAVAVLVVAIAVLVASPAEAWIACYGCSVPFDGCPKQGAWLCEQYAEIACSDSPRNRNREYFVCHMGGVGCRKSFVQRCRRTGCFR